MTKISLISEDHNGLWRQTTLIPPVHKLGEARHRQLEFYPPRSGLGAVAGHHLMLVLYGRLTFQPACVFRGLNKGLNCVVFCAGSRERVCTITITSLME